MSTPHQPSLFPDDSAPLAPALPDGFLYHPDFITPEQEQTLVAHLSQIQYDEVRMHGVVARRHTQHYGMSYSYSTRQVKTGSPIPEFLLPLHERLGAWTHTDPAAFVEVLLSEYPAGAGIGWHRDAPAFGIVAGVSLLTPCEMRLRPQQPPTGTPAEPPAKRPSRSLANKPLTQLLAPRSAYLLSGDARWKWQHHIPTTPALRYSITFRTLRTSP